eukprot:gnl/TRDRNA2_/TRDRNA2_155263_c0_seq1.p1 gnl/TRDRNA2_/TRDRNA2_155263_c0~~gnl/TRDRNA2_/TRDRNA2_155263_c0_seq1.p1  ORF type:complete len:106 (-),score=21.66 gnl/TRDRNA2_/TRDRNA2_155263_c0_seq1:47-364(-)
MNLLVMAIMLSFASAFAAVCTNSEECTEDEQSLLQVNIQLASQAQNVARSRWRSHSSEGVATEKVSTKEYSSEEVKGTEEQATTGHSSEAVKGTEEEGLEQAEAA